MIKIISIVGARPQFIKAATVSRVLRKQFKELIVHTGQHYDYSMSRLFFEELDMPQPDYHLNVGSGSHGYTTGQMLMRVEKVLSDKRCDLVLVYGDTNSTLAGTLAAAKLNISVGHIEAGLRSFNRKMPEEINRILTDHCADLLFCPTETAIQNLKRESITRGVHLVGDVMYDAALFYAEFASQRSDILDRLDLREKTFHLCTIHRPANTDSRDALSNIVQALIQSKEVIVFPVHPRTKKYLRDYGLWNLLHNSGNVSLLEPVSYLDMIQLERHAKTILTDSGGMQKEAYFYRVPCITLRNETEWVETVGAGWNTLAGSDSEKILRAIQSIEIPKTVEPFYGSGDASQKICEVIDSYCKTKMNNG